MPTCVTVTQPTPGGTDAYGDPIAGTVDTWQIQDVLIAPRVATESTGRGREGTVIGLDMYCPAGSKIGHDDTVTIPDGEPYAGEYVVDAEPARWQSRHTTTTGGVVAALQQAKG